MMARNKILETFGPTDSAETHSSETLHLIETMISFFNGDETNGTSLSGKDIVHVLKRAYEDIILYDELYDRLECELDRDLITWQERYSNLVRIKDDANKYWEKHCENLYSEYRKRLMEKDREIYQLRKSLKNSEYGKCANDPANFCGNCAHYAQMGICVQHYVKRVDPDDASCKHFKSNQVERDKPEQPCCDACNRDDCSKCNLCPF